MTKPMHCLDLLDLDLITTRQAAKLFGISTDTILIWARSGTFAAAVRVGRTSYLWPRKAIERHLAEYKKLATGVKATKLARAANTVERATRTIQSPHKEKARST